MVGAPRANPSPGPAWKRIRTEVLLLCTALIAAGVVLFFLPWPEGESILLKAIGTALILTGLIVAATRPWNFMKRMEMQLLVHKQRLQGQMSEMRQQGEHHRVDEDEADRPIP